MRMLMRVTMPNEKFDAAVRDGTIGKNMARIMESVKPEAAYFTEFDGNRTAIMIVNIDEPSKIPSIGEPFFHALTPAAGEARSSPATPLPSPWATAARVP